MTRKVGIIQFFIDWLFIGSAGGLCGPRGFGGFGGPGVGFGGLVGPGQRGIITERRILNCIVMTTSFKNWSMFTEKLALFYSVFAQIMGESDAKKSEFLVHLDRFSNYLRNFKERSKLATLYHQFEQRQNRIESTFQ